MRKDILRIARKCRKWAESRAVFLDDVDTDLCGMCAIASRKVFRELRKAGISSKLIVGQDHVFNLVNVDRKPHILDITASQFGSFKEVTLMPYPDLGKADWWSKCRAFKSESGLLSYMRRDGWPTGQITMQYSDV